jgi:hypothetical protein
VKSTIGSVKLCRRFALAVIVGTVRNYVIDSGLLTVGSRPFASSISTGLELSVSTKK